VIKEKIIECSNRPKVFIKELNEICKKMMGINSRIRVLRKIMMN